MMPVDRRSGTSTRKEERDEMMKTKKALVHACGSRLVFFPLIRFVFHPLHGNRINVNGENISLFYLDITWASLSSDKDREKNLTIYIYTCCYPFDARLYSVAWLSFSSPRNYVYLTRVMYVHLWITLQHIHAWLSRIHATHAKVLSQTILNNKWI